MIRIYNTLSGEKESLPSPEEQKKIRLFVCGPTVYDYLHIGNARTYIFFDFVAKYLRSQGYDVSYVQNITDIDDKIIKRAAEQQKEPTEIAREFTAAYFEDMATLGVDGVTKYAPATDFITQIAAQVERLIEKGFVYEIDNDGWYFDISKDEDYGKLSHRTTEQAEDATSRIDDAIGKRNKGDFCVWKFSRDGEPSWPSTLGAGRPGWHIEDTAISEFYFGLHYEIHGGGIDLKFPHHEAEIAQAESLREPGDNEPFVKTWMHTGPLLVDGKKMSKSLGNFITIRDFLKKYDANVLRWIVLTHHYRSPLNYSEELAQLAIQQLDNLNQLIHKLEIVSNKKNLREAIQEEPIQFFKFEEALRDDFNTPKLIGFLFEEYITKTNPRIWTMSPEEAQIIAVSLYGFFSQFGISLNLPKIPQKIKDLAAERELSRASKQFTQSDALRNEINALGYDIEDTPKGPFLWPHPSKQN
jgi:cysteinyl-tRNA synthetase